MEDKTFGRLCQGVALCMVLVGNATWAEDRAGVNWPSFRGLYARGVAEGFSTPTEWNVEQGKNIRWKTAIPGMAHASPIVWGDKVFTITAISGSKKDELKVGLYGNIAPVQDDTVCTWRVYCVDKNTGKILWDRLAFEGVPTIKRHTKATHANSTPATDGKHVVTFLGSEGLFCFDMDGKLLWWKDLGLLDSGYYVVPQAQWGFGSSPVIHDGRVIVQCDVQNDSFVAAFDVKTGEKIWETARKEVPTWSTPTIETVGGRTQVILNGYKHIGAYDFATGKEIWKMVGGGDIPVPTPVVADGLVYITNAHGQMAPLVAIKTTATGDVSIPDNDSGDPDVAWSYRRRGVYMQTPVVYRGLLYACRGNGTLTCYDAKTGEVKYRQRLGSGRTGFTASPVVGDGKIYFSSEEGDIYVVQAGPEFKLLATNPMGEICMATPAISEGSLIFRTHHHLVSVSQKAPGP